MPIKVPIDFAKDRFASGFYIAKPVLDLLAERLDEAARFKEVGIDHKERVSMPALIQRHGRFKTAVMCVAVEKMASAFLLHNHGVRGAIERTLPLVSLRAMVTFDTAYDFLLDKAHTLVDAAAKSLDDKAPTSLRAPAGVVAAGVDRGLRLALGEGYVGNAREYVKALPQRASKEFSKANVVETCSQCIVRMEKMKEKSRLVSLLCAGVVQSSVIGVFGASMLFAFTHVYTIRLDEEQVERTSDLGLVSGAPVNTRTTVLRLSDVRGVQPDAECVPDILVVNSSYNSDEVEVKVEDVIVRDEVIEDEAIATVEVYGIEGHIIEKVKETVYDKEKNMKIDYKDYQIKLATCVEEEEEAGGDFDEGVENVGADDAEVEVEVEHEEHTVSSEKDDLGARISDIEVGAGDYSKGYQDFERSVGYAAHDEDTFGEENLLEVENLLMDLSLDVLADAGPSYTTSMPCISSRSFEEGFSKIATSVSFNYRPREPDMSLKDEEDRISAEISTAISECCLNHLGHISWDMEVGSVEELEDRDVFADVELKEVEVKKWRGEEEEKESEPRDEVKAEVPVAAIYPLYGGFFSGILNRSKGKEKETKVSSDVFQLREMSRSKENIPPSARPSSSSMPSFGLTPFASPFVPKAYLKPMTSTPNKSENTLPSKSKPAHWSPATSMPVTIRAPAPPAPCQTTTGSRKERHLMRMRGAKPNIRVLGDHDFNAG